ncbi:UNVERIFIED_CONTAM: hypothetical protein FKN15_023860 [Acipenser sinensis]
MITQHHGRIPEAVNNKCGRTYSFSTIIAYIDDQFERYLHDESGLNRRHIVDNRVHCCFYFISPLGHGVPFAVVGSNQQIEAKGKKVRGRLYPWGVVEVENPEHNDFLKLRTMLITHMQDLQEVTQDLHYENFRSERLKKGGRLSSHGFLLPLSPAYVAVFLSACLFLCVSTPSLNTNVV